MNTKPFDLKLAQQGNPVIDIFRDSGEVSQLHVYNYPDGGQKLFYMVGNGVYNCSSLDTSHLRMKVKENIIHGVLNYYEDGFGEGCYTTLSDARNHARAKCLGQFHIHLDIPER